MLRASCFTAVPARQILCVGDKVSRGENQHVSYSVVT